MKNKFKNEDLVLAPHNETNVPQSGQIRDLDAQVRTWLSSEVAKGHPREDTISCYRLNLEHWFTWCRVSGVNAGAPSRKNVETYRAELNQSGLLPSTVALKLTVVRGFYQSAKNDGLITLNPAAGVKPPSDCRIPDRKKTLTSGQAERLLEALPPVDTLRGKRDRLIIGLMLLEGLRRVDVHRANDEDLEEALLGLRLLVHGKHRDRHKYPREDTLEALGEYLCWRGPVPQETVKIHGKEVKVTPLICGISKADRPTGRISRIGLNFIVNGYLEKAGVKRQGTSCHALRHTFGNLLYQKTHDLIAVQDELGHKYTNTTAIYAEKDRGERRFSEMVPLKLTPLAGHQEDGR